MALCGVLQNKALSGGGMEDSVIDLQVNVSILKYITYNESNQFDYLKKK